MRFTIILLLLITSIKAIAGDYITLSAQTTNISGQNLLAINFTNAPKWHTYWKNPGDSGLAIQTLFYADEQEVKLESLAWPRPVRFIEQGDLWGYGYNGEYSLFYKLTDSLKNKTLQIKINALVCLDICVPDQSEFSITLDQNLTGTFAKAISQKELETRYQNLPKLAEKPKNIQISLVKAEEENKLALHYYIENFDKNLLPKHANIITPYLFENFDYKHEEAYFDSNSNTLIGRIYIDWDGIYLDPPLPLPRDGIFENTISPKFLIQYPSNQPAKIIQANFKQLALSGDNALTKTFKSLTSVLSIDKKKSDSENTKESLWYYILFAFLGGLILNIMPCVLPVISLKLFSLISHQNLERKKIFNHNLAYSLGVLFSFWVLAIIIIAIKQSGEYVGWGFQLSSPLFVYLLMLGTFVFGLNLFGLFEFKTPGGSTLGKVQFKNPYINDFSNGILATILSTPCSAPFLGTALGFAFTASIFEIFIIFTSIAIGLAFPFLMTGAFPRLIKFMPKPGEWMNKAKYFLGLSLIGTSIWLYDVLISLINGPAYSVYILFLILMIFFVFFSARFLFRSIYGPLIICLLFIASSFYIFTRPDFETTPGNSQSQTQNSNWENWSQGLMKKYQQEKQAAFIDFTAQWCLTCKVNKKLVLDTTKFQDFVTENNIKLIRADWTKQDPSITKFLASYNIVGVPAYFVIDSNGNIHSLGETITIDKIQKSFIQ